MIAIDPFDRSPQFVADRAGVWGRQVVAHDDALNGIRHDGPEGTSPHPDRHHAVIGARHAVDGPIQTLAARWALEARNVQVQFTCGSGQRAGGEHEAT